MALSMTPLVSQATPRLLYAMAKLVPAGFEVTIRVQAGIDSNGVRRASSQILKSSEEEASPAALQAAQPNVSEIARKTTKRIFGPKSFLSFCKSKRKRGQSPFLPFR
jgi:hypothetical protein